MTITTAINAIAHANRSAVARLVRARATWAPTPSAAASSSAITDTRIAWPTVTDVAASTGDATPGATT